MKQIAIISGKGGTGKTTLAGSLAYLFENHVMADCDVDAPNLHLLLNSEKKESYEFFGNKKAEITDKCIGCGRCLINCKFDAVIPGEIYEVDKYACEGCGVCKLVCPVDAINLNKCKSGNFYYSTAKKFSFCHAQLLPGEETSGGLVAEVRKLAQKKAEQEGKDIILIDGAPGIGCAATSSIVGTDFAIIVTEPTVSGIHDLERIVETVKNLRTDFYVVINKFDINIEKTMEIKHWCRKENIEILAEIPFDKSVIEASRNSKPVIFMKDSISAKKIEKIYNKMLEKLFRR